MSLLRVSVALCTAIVGCSSKTSQTCMPGQQVACACPEGRSGIQVCAQDGLRMGPCDCGAAKSNPSTAAPTQQGEAAQVPKAAEPALVKCPSDFVAQAERVQPPEGGSDREAERCTPGLFPEPGWVIVHRVGFDYYRAVLDAQSGRLIAKARTESKSGSTTLQIKRLSTIDFDGDGKSEILEVLGYEGNKGCTGEKVSIFGVKGKELRLLIDFHGKAACDGMDEDSNFAYEATFDITTESDGTRGINVNGRATRGSYEATKNFIVGKKHIRFHGGTVMAE